MSGDLSQVEVRFQAGDRVRVRPTMVAFAGELGTVASRRVGGSGTRWVSVVMDCGHSCWFRSEELRRAAGGAS